MKILLTGGAGYVGSHVLRELLSAGHDPVVLDDLSNGHRAAVGEVELVEGDILDVEVLEKVFERDRFDCVMHFCGLIEAGESVTRPDRYYRVNVAGGVNLLNVMARAEVRRIVFSSTAAVYGHPERLPIDEEHPTVPVNPYGRTKLMFERMLEDYRQAFGLGYVSLRYFNAAGADASAEIGEAHRSESHLIPLVFRATLAGGEFTLHGDDYDTRDGTAVRDFVHVSDLARAHVLALDVLEERTARVYNIGSGTGHSVREVVETARRVSGRDLSVTVGPRRPGDTASLVASSGRIERELGWKARFTELVDIMASAWKWHSTHPEGFGG
ncbi:MAG TPA: UDP-glucose 4-epimerase GalE [Planctomycetota bacterium]|nr:UDP-glucose 4-epimerase GalE [Planctomycetota bacterium]